MFNIELLKNLQQRTADLYTYLEIEQKEIEIQNEEEVAASPEFGIIQKKLKLL